MALNKQIAMTPVHHKPYKAAAFGVSDEAWIPKRSSWLAKFLCVYKLLFKPCEQHLANLPRAGRVLLKVGT